MASAGMNKVTVTDILGQDVLSLKLNYKRSETIDISSLEAGVYSVHISTMSSDGTAKLIVSR